MDKRGNHSLYREIPSNPKFDGVSAIVKTGRTMRDFEILSHQAVARRKGELFRRIRPSTVAKLLRKTTITESIYALGGEESIEFDDSASVFSMAASEAPSMVTVNTEALGMNDDSEFVVLDLRDPDEYQRFHIKEAVSFPTPNITRDRMPAEVFRLKNVSEKFIVIYAWDERPGVEASKKFAEKGFDNVYLLSGGVEEFIKQFPELVEGHPPQIVDSKKSNSAAFPRRNVNLI